MGLTDSKKLTEKKRVEFDREIRQNAVAWAIAQVDVETIDRINIRQASLLAMRLAVGQLALSPDFLLIDGRDTIDWPCMQLAVIQGDGTTFRLRRRACWRRCIGTGCWWNWTERFRGMGWRVTRGMGARSIWRHWRGSGPTPLHRKSFHPVAQAVLQFE